MAKKPTAESINTTLELRNVPIEKLIPNPKNPRINLVPGMPLYEKLKKSLEGNQYIDPIIWNETTGHIISGHQRFSAMKNIKKEKGEEFTSVDVIVVHIPEDQEMNPTIALNKITGLWDQELLAEAFKDMPIDQRELTGYDEFEIEAMLNATTIEWADDDADSSLKEEYKEPNKVLLRCPNCNHIDTKAHFITVHSDDDASENQ